MKIKKFHLKDFPEDRIRVLFRDQMGFIDENIRFFHSVKEFADFLGIESKIIRHWKKQKLYIPLNHIKKIISKRKLSWGKIEKNVVAYKNPNSGLIVRKPILPIIETPELFALIAHLIADGSVNKNNIPSYTNTNFSLIKNFDKLIQSVFGNIENKIYKRQSKAFQINSSRIIVDLIKSFYGITFNSLTARIPRRLKQLPSEYSIAFIRAYSDDEAAVDLNHRITIYSNNKKILKDLRDILSDKLDFKEVTKVLIKSKVNYYITIKPKEIIKYNKIIGFNHPIKKERLQKLVRMRKTKVKSLPQNTKTRILKLLNQNNLSSEDLTYKLGIRSRNVQINLKQLEKKGIIRKINKERQIPIWIKWRYKE